MTKNELEQLVEQQAKEIEELKSKNETLIALSAEMNETMKQILDSLNRTTADKLKDFTNNVIDFNKDLIKRERDFSDKLVESLKNGGHKVAETWQAYHKKTSDALDKFSDSTKAKMSVAIDKSKEIFAAATVRIKSLCNTMLRGFNYGKDKIGDTVSTFKEKANEIADNAFMAIDRTYDNALDEIYNLGINAVETCIKAKDAMIKGVIAAKDATNEHIIEPCVNKIKEGIEYDKRTYEMIKERRAIKMEAKNEIKEQKALIKEEVKKKLSEVER